MAGVAIKNFTRQHLNVGASATFSAIANRVLPGWDISLVFVGSKRAHALNMQLRKKDYVPNVLSYVVGPMSAEIIICPSEARRQAPDFNLTSYTFTLYLFIHGALHIKGWAHGDKMEVCTHLLLTTFAPGAARAVPNETAHRNRNRYRHLPGESGGRRRGR